VMLSELEMAVRDRSIVPMCREDVAEFLSFIRNDRGRLEAAQGAYDDAVMSWAGLWQMRGYARWSSGKTVKMPYTWG